MKAVPLSRASPRTPATARTPAGPGRSGLAALLLLPFACGVTPARAQVAYVIVDVVSNDPVVQAVGKLEDSVTEKMDQQITNQETQISRATELNRSIGDWSNPGPAAVPQLSADTLVQEHTAELRNGLTFDTQTASLGTFQTAAGGAMTVPAADLADYAQLDQTGRQTRDALAAIAGETKATNQEVAQTYEAMIQPGLSQQAYEKLRGKLQALNLHLQGLQAEQRNALAFLQSQAALTRNKLDRDREIAAQVQKANQTEEVTALADLQLAELSWR